MSPPHCYRAALLVPEMGCCFGTLACRTDDPLAAAAFLGTGATNSEEGPLSSGDDDYVPTAVARRGPGARRGRVSRQSSLAAVSMPPQPLALEGPLARDVEVPGQPAQQLRQPPPPQLQLFGSLGPEDAAAAATVAAALFAGAGGEQPGLEGAMLAGALSSSFAPYPGAFMLNPLAAAAAAAATYAAAATMAQRQQAQEASAVHESMAGDATLPLSALGGAALQENAVGPRALVMVPAAASKMPTALTSHLSDVGDPADPDIRGGWCFASTPLFDSYCSSPLPTPHTPPARGGYVPA